MLDTYDYWPGVVANHRKERKRGSSMLQILVRDGEDTQTSVMLFREVVQEVPLYGLETWVMTPHLLRDLVLFTIWLHADSLDTNPGRIQIAYGSNCPLCRYWRRWCWILWRSMSRGIRTLSHSAYQRGPYTISFQGRRGF